MYCLLFANRLPVRRIHFTDDELCRPARIVSIRQYLMPLFNTLGRKKIRLNIYDILIMEIRPFHPFRTWKVHVVIFSFHATHFDTQFTLLHFRYVNARFDIQYTMLLIFTHCFPPSTSGMLTHDSTSGVSNYRQIMVLFVKSELWLSLCADWLRSIFYCYLLTFGKLTRWQQSLLCSRVVVTKTSHYKTRKWFFHLDRSFSQLLLKNTFRKHTSFGKSLAAWRNLAATRIFLSPSLI